jgi:O-antigen/teichoic acid export membrane protein
VLSLMLIPRGIGALPGVLIERELSFASRAKGELVGVAVQAATAIPLAVGGAGVWSLVAGQLAGTSASAVVYWLVAPFRPSPRLFSWRMWRELARYGRHVTTANILFLINGNLDTATVARLLSAADVGYYNLAWRLCNLPATGIGYIVGRAMFPAYATLQSDKPAFRDAFVTNVRRVAIFSLPVGVGIFVAARPIVIAIFGSDWSAAVEPLRILAFFGIIRSFSGTTGAVLQAAGRPYLVTLLNVFHLGVLCLTLFTLTPAYGLKGAALAMTLTALASLIPAYWFALRILELPLGAFAAELRRPLLCSLPLIAALSVLTLSLGGTGPVVRLLLLAAAGIGVYAVSVMTIARGEVRAITSAFRST